MKHLHVPVFFALVLTPSLSFGSGSKLLNVGFAAPTVPHATVNVPETGAIVLDGTTFWGNVGTPTTPNWISFGTGGAPTAPTVQKFLSGSGTYTTPTSPSPLYIKVTMVGGGGAAGGFGSCSPSLGGSGGSSPA
jgi:hypothetical protein